MYSFTVFLFVISSLDFLNSALNLSYASSSVIVVLDMALAICVSENPLALRNAVIAASE